jgi:hypothetical protein
MKKKIEKPWAVYGYVLGAWGIGKVTQESGKCLDILYSEGQYYPPSLWDSKWVTRFDDPEDALDYYISHIPLEEKSREQASRIFYSDFPSAYSKTKKKG